MGGNSPQRRKADELPGALESTDEIAEILDDRRPAVFLDYDGTLTPIVSQPEDAILSDDMRDVLRDLADVCTVAVVSGRDRLDVEPLVGLDQLVYAGSHGFDIKGPDGLRMEYEGGVEHLPSLEAAERELHERLANVPGARVERKRFAIANHYRNVAAEDQDRVQEAVHDVARRHEGLRVSGGKKVLELRPDIDWDKGRAVFWLLDALDLDDDDEVVPFYVGDDVTDEDAFRALSGRGVSIVVGKPEYPTHASYGVEDVAEVKKFLEFMIGQAGGNR
ncbi:MAG: trehalose-phosphatase [Gemmatimonadetes bacterium]|uniref:Trehalose 6-phosphate phosphatase n=1 Tax=Candidatus Kutchimonas denitrificans TaxID=3056748 RepID=A0AAE4ZA61_9BACT|nr:trehalose-phosphatase [Gemmatimonadota bacterium]NIR76610.1 trehalose-phosphatase [Candidatus Kutchimonas denitrificans]NIS03379.1 trehalose-phosphatase [Gemmatimonadota bacterium]NIT69240.1 trehalose-phosphatase [Gemmatimonadota bacterium]NIU54712.1 trehalose-phosphatase [Gemmatimonadota bacterium]